MRYVPETAESEFDFVLDLGCLPRNLLVTLDRQVFDVYGILTVFDLGRRKFWHVNERLFIRNHFRSLSGVCLAFSQQQILEIDLRALGTLDLHLILRLNSLLLQPILDLEQLQLAVLSLLNLNGRIGFLRFIQLSGLLQLAKNADSALKLSQLLIYLLAGYHCRCLAGLIIELFVVSLSTFLHSFLVLLGLFAFHLVSLLPFEVGLRF
tara:strand:- start:501 stop:1124 length:624 start_codon:yes stop_codon:yes gene_type:complete